MLRRNLHDETTRYLLRRRARHEPGFRIGARLARTTNSTIGSKGASTGTNGTLHSTANRALRGTAGSERSVNGTANSTIGSGGGAAGTTGTAHSTTNRALNSAK